MGFLRLHTDNDTDGDGLDPIPFPRQSVPGRGAGLREEPSAPGVRGRPADAAAEAERTLDEIQNRLDELHEIVESIPFPRHDGEDDGPWAA